MRSTAHQSEWLLCRIVCDTFYPKPNLVLGFRFLFFFSLAMTKYPIIIQILPSHNVDRKSRIWYTSRPVIATTTTTPMQKYL